MKSHTRTHDPQQLQYEHEERLRSIFPEKGWGPGKTNDGHQNLGAGPAGEAGGKKKGGGRRDRFSTPQGQKRHGAWGRSTEKRRAGPARLFSAPGRPEFAPQVVRPPGQPRGAGGTVWAIHRLPHRRPQFGGRSRAALAAARFRPIFSYPEIPVGPPRPSPLETCGADPFPPIDLAKKLRGPRRVGRLFPQFRSRPPGDRWADWGRGRGRSAVLWGVGCSGPPFPEFGSFPVAAPYFIHSLKPKVFLPPLEY